MATMNYALLGKQVGNADDQLLFEIKYAGEILRAWQAKTVVDGHHKVRNLSNAKGAKFPLTGIKTAEYYTPGTQLLGTQSEQDMIEILVDQKLLSHTFIDSYEDLKDNYDLRSEYVEQDAQALAQAYDKTVLQVMINAAREAGSAIQGHSGGTKLTNPDYHTNMDTLLGDFGEVQAAFSEKFVTDEKKTCFLKPAQYWTAVNSDRVIDQNLNAGMNGGVDTGKVKMVSGIQLKEAQNFPTATVTGSQKAIYDGVFENTAAIIVTPSAVGTVRLKQLGVESQKMLDYQGTLSVASMGVGHGVLRPACALEMATA